jgi:DNA anti-recombination protein RmuC
VEKQLEKRLRENNEGQRFIEDNSDSLGTANVKTLQEQADEISLASYLANVGVKQTRKDLQARIEESTAVKNTLDREIEATKKASQDPARSEGEKAQAQKRQQAAEAAKAKIDSEVQQAQQLQQQLEERIKKVQEAYQKSLEDLRKKIDEKAKEKGSETKEPEKGKGSQKKS